MNATKQSNKVMHRLLYEKQEHINHQNHMIKVMEREIARLTMENRELTNILNAKGASL